MSDLIPHSFITASLQEQTGVLTIPAIQQKVAAIAFERIFIAFYVVSKGL